MNDDHSLVSFPCGGRSAEPSLNCETPLKCGLRAIPPPNTVFMVQTNQVAARPRRRSAGLNFDGRIIGLCDILSLIAQADRSILDARGVPESLRAAASVDSLLRAGKRHRGEKVGRNARMQIKLYQARKADAAAGRKLPELRNA